MADTNSHHAGAEQTESDGVDYRGIVVFVIILVITTVVCELIVVGMYKFFDAQSRTNGAARAPLSAPALTLPPAPNLLTDEPGNLAKFRAREASELGTYGWLDKSAGSVRLPIDRAKDLLIERGLPSRSTATANTEPKAASKKVDVKK